MEVQRIQALLEKYTSGQLSEQEQEELSDRLASLDEQEKETLFNLYAPLWEKVKNGQLPSPHRDRDWQQMLDMVMHSEEAEPEQPVVPFYKKPWIRYAAVFLLIAGGTYIWMQQRPAIAPAKQIEQVTYQPAPIQPGGHKARLTLSNGNTIVLDSAANGSLAMQGNTQVMKLDNGSILYKAGTTPHDEMLYNTISIPKGGQYQLTLPDGTSVWLNALSSLYYPVSFTGNKREVALEGEAYFEVAKDRSRPFRVTYKNTQIEVLGTHFNVMAYEDEAAIQTTVLEGAVRVQQEGSRQQVLTPGKQARINRRTHEVMINKVEAGMFVAWKEGFFHFDKADMATVLRQLARWYDLEISFKGDLPKDLFSGKIERSLPLQSILHLLKQSNLHFEIKDRTLTVLPHEE